MNAMLRAAAAALIVGFVATAGPPASKVLLLDTRQLVEGEIELTGDGYRVRRTDGETMIPRNRVLSVCADRAAAYAVLRDKTGTTDARERLKLAQWCHNNGLPQQAVAEAKLALILRPEHRETLLLLRYYEAAANNPQRPATVRAEPQAAPIPETIDCSPEALQHFTMRVQPVLMNACLSCHGSAAKMPLKRGPSRGDTFQNLAAAMAQVNRQKPVSSALLQKALTAHGGAPTPPLRDRGTPAYQQLEIWVQMLAADPASTTLPDLLPEAKGTSSFAADRPENKPEGPKDPFDPVDFNKPKPKQ